MKASKYNYIIPYGDKQYIFFNGITKRFFLVSDENVGKFKEIVDNPNTEVNVSKYSFFLDRMKAEGFILEDDVDEMSLISEEFERQRTPSRYMLMVLPTYRCNLNCWYCVQEHRDVDITDEIARRIKTHIKKYLSSSGVKHFRLSWFGGEPLLAYERIREITEFSQSFCKGHSVEFSCDITTNGLLLSPDRIADLSSLGVLSYQITIDGCREKHNLVKRSEEGTAFDVAVNNVLGIVRNASGAECILRINYSDKTLEPAQIMHDVNQLIPPEYRERITIAPYKIWQVEDSKIRYEKVVELNRIAHRKNYRIHPLCGSLCYADGVHYNCFFPNGRVGKCDNARMEDANGVLTDTGEIIWTLPNAFESHLALSNNSECVNCKYLPFCMGPCPAKRTDMLASSGKITCQYPESDKERIVRDFILRYCKNRITQEQ